MLLHQHGPPTLTRDEALPPDIPAPTPTPQGPPHHPRAWHQDHPHAWRPLHLCPDWVKEPSPHGGPQDLVTPSAVPQVTPRPRQEWSRNHSLLKRASLLPKALSPHAPPQGRATLHSPGQACGHCRRGHRALVRGCASCKGWTLKTVLDFIVLSLL